ncbi:N-acetylmuramoyl-L-alanine amidase [Thermocrinis jamiesonii]|uniref:N-acetylmuramoyl-L-alanine amidase n=1 Tax=Thermocrinis jamiesonii TaxID=1302351 RepID=UPI0004955703|nr:N-acetylmuramoyl-L-alanine amidase [Thermocrinis jamiesonii]
MFQKILIIFSLLFCSFSFGVQVSYREGNYPDKKRLVLEFEKRVDYRVLLLENPKRIVVDVMEEVRPPTNIKARVGKHPWGTRFVFDTEYSEVKAFSLEDPFRIVIDVYKNTIPDDDPLIAILDPVVLKVIAYRDTKNVEGRLISERAKGTIITQRRVIVLDAGHGGRDPGAIGYKGIKEKDINLAITLKLAQLLNKDGRFKVILTRKDDTFVGLEERAKKALRNRADLFVSIHANASPKGISEHAKGTMVFAISSEAAQKKKEAIVNNDNYAKLAIGVSDVPLSVRRIMADLALDVTLYESVQFGNILSKKLKAQLGREVEFKGIQRAGFAVLKTPGIPSVLVEVGFITNPQEALLMSDPQFQEKFAKAMYDAIVEYFFPNI